MTAHLIDWPDDRSRPLRPRHTQAMDAVLHLYEDLIIPRFRSQRAPMPIVVLRTEEDCDSRPLPLSSDAPETLVTEIVEVLHRVYRDGRVLCKLLPEGYCETDERRRSAGSVMTPARAPRRDPGTGEGAGEESSVNPGEYGSAIAKVRDLSVSAAWENAWRSQYKPYAFPRSRMLRAIEDAGNVEDLLAGKIHRPSPHPQPPGGVVRPKPDVVLRNLRKVQWRPAKDDDSDRRPLLGALYSLISPANLLGGLLVAAISAKLIGPEATPLVLGVLAGAVVVLFLAQSIQENLAPLSWLGPANQWFTTTTFIGPVDDVPQQWLKWRPRLSWQVRKARARFVVEQLITAQYGAAAGNPAENAADPGGTTQDQALQFYLQLRVLAMLEDLRANHRRWALDLRHRKRTKPPMLFLPEVDKMAGGIALLQAISDVRSRRSEQDPLLILANSEELYKRARTGPQTMARNTYEAWLTSMRIDQSPSLGSHWPWVMDYPVANPELAGSAADKLQPTARRSVWNLWSRVTLAILLVALVGASLWRNNQLGNTYCGGGLFYSNQLLVWTPGSPRQCVGVDTSGAQEFIPPNGGVSLANTIPGPGRAAGPGQDGTTLGQVTLGLLESDIAAQNQDAEQSGDYVSFVYSGPFVSTNSNETQALSGVKELAGVYAWQYNVNNSNDSLKLRIDIASGGLDFASKQRMADEIVTAASQDPTIVGVIGLGRDTSSSPAVTLELAKADLAVVDTTNSDDNLPDDWNYFGMAATNSEEAAALRPYIGQAANSTAIIFERHTTPEDLYSVQQGGAAMGMLRSAHFHLVGGGPLAFDVTDDNQSNIAQSPPALAACAATSHPSVVYLAGRSDDLPGLMAFIQSHADCFASRVIVLSGDDLTKNEYNDSVGSFFPPQVTLYYAALTDTEQTGPGSGLAQQLQSALRLSSLPGYTDPVYTDGTIALAYDAADALYNAAEDAASVGRSGIAWALRCQVSITNGATGHIGFTDVGHGIEIVRVTAYPDGSPDLTPWQYSGPSSGSCPPPIRR
jgi:ABC-type branched-subunit amino acid transport system substrate-binding protein